MCMFLITKSINLINKLQLIGLMGCLEKESPQIVVHQPFLDLIVLLFGATGNIAWHNRYHYVDILWQEDASCALSKNQHSQCSTAWSN